MRASQCGVYFFSGCRSKRREWMYLLKIHFQHSIWTESFASGSSPLSDEAEVELAIMQ